jgi:hypothetical protein
MSNVRYDMDGLNLVASAKQTIASATTTSFDFGTPDDINTANLSGYRPGDRLLIILTGLRDDGGAEVVPANQRHRRRHAARALDHGRLSRGRQALRPPVRPGGHGRGPRLHRRGTGTVGCYVAELDDLGNVDDLVILYGTTEITDYTLYPKNALSKGGVYERAHFSLSLAASPYAPAYWGPGRYSKIDLVIDGLWGWTAVPTSVKQATMLQATRLAARRDSPFGVAGSPSEGSELRLLAKVDPDVETVIGKKYRREWWAA